MKTPKRHLVVFDSPLRGDVERSAFDGLYAYRALAAQYRGRMDLLLTADAALLALGSQPESNLVSEPKPEWQLLRNLDQLVEDGARIYVFFPKEISAAKISRNGFQQVTEKALADIIAESAGVFFL